MQNTLKLKNRGYTQEDDLLFKKESDIFFCIEVPTLFNVFFLVVE
jgi:hypothetical protein